MSVKQVMKDAEERMEKAVGVFLNELKGLRTGRATPGLVENLRVDAYGGGSETPLKQLAQISVPEPTTAEYEDEKNRKEGELDAAGGESDTGAPAEETPGGEEGSLEEPAPEL